jgi:hypothetical protein
MGGAANLGAAGEVECCPTCGTSSRQMEFRGEICLHFPGGLESLNKPLVWVFPQVPVCLNCGGARFTVSEKELKLINENQ